LLLLAVAKEISHFDAADRREAQSGRPDEFVKKNHPKCGPTRILPKVRQYFYGGKNSPFLATFEN
jgi:hypothetical protein